jgi:hypothetical protein
MSLPALRVSVGLCLLGALPAAADVLPTERRTIWSPGIPGGIPARTTVCATIDAATYGNGSLDATAGIQAAIDACPAGQVVRLSAGNFLVNGAHPITIHKGVVLRGAGPAATKLRKLSTSANPLILVGRRWLEEAGSVNLTANAPKGARSVTVTSAAGFSVGQLVVLDELTDTAYVNWGTNPAAQPGGAARGWFTRYNRPVGQMLEIAAISGNTLSFTTPLHITFDTAHAAQLTRYTIPYGARFAGVEDLYVRGGQDDNITLRFAMYSWVKNVESDWSMGDSFALDSCFRCVLRDSYAHDTPNPYPGGAGYMLSIARYTADSLVENNIFMNGNKVMVMRASGGGNVIGYNYFDNGYIGNYLGWMETGLNASHLTCPHYELFEGNLAFNIDGDDTWGGAVRNTFFRNHATGKRRSYADINNRRAIGLMYGHYDYSFVGNVLGTANQNPAPYSGFAYEDLYPWGDNPIGLWRLGYTPTNWNAPAEARVVQTTHRHGNFDYATNTVRWTAGYDQALPSSLYLTSKPAFFGDLPWPWVDPAGATKVHTLPAKARFDGVIPNPRTLSVARAGTGSGTVTSSPAGISCGGTCAALFPANTVVTLTAGAAAGSTFSGWSGACTGTGACQVTMSANQSVTATFTSSVVRHTLTVTRAGNGAGTVTSSPAGINCGTACSATYPVSTAVTLTAVPAAGSTFAGWTGACSGAGACQVTMSAARSVGANFVLGVGGLVAAWGFNEGAGATVRDASPHGNTGTLVNGPAWTSGRTGGALSFDGVDDRVRVNDSPSLDLTTRATFEAWVFPTVALAGWRTILQKEVDAYFFTASGGGPGNRPTAGGTFGGACCAHVAAPSALPANTWTHVAAAYDGSQLRFYVNGALAASAAASGSYTVNGSPLWMGGNAVYGEHLRGKLDDVRIYNRALTAAEIQRDMGAAVP